VVISSQPSGLHAFTSGVGQGLDLVFSGNQVVVDTTLRTLHLAVESTLIAALVGVPLGCALGLGRSRVARALLRLASAVTRVPPVAIGVLVYLLLANGGPPYGAGLLAGLHSAGKPVGAYLDQTLLAIPIIVALTASAVKGVSGLLLDQARAFGASNWKRGLLALREARRRVIAAILVAMGVTITAIGAIIVSNAPLTARVGDHYQPLTLAIGAFTTFKQVQGSTAAAPQTAALEEPTVSLAVAYTIVLLGLFVLIAAMLTRLQSSRLSWIPGGQS
jgi:tungstate transport system permease protein